MHELDWRPAKRPERTALNGDSVLLEPLDVARPGEDLFAATAGADSTWDYLPYGPFSDRREFVGLLEQRAPIDDPLTFTVIDREANAARGPGSPRWIVPAPG